MDQMSIIRVWTDPVFRQSLSADMKAQVPASPAGDSLVELDNDALRGVIGGNTSNSYCECVSDTGSCGRICTFTTECPGVTTYCC